MTLLFVSGVRNILVSSHTIQYADDCDIQQNKFKLTYQVYSLLSINIRKTNIIYQSVPGTNEEPPDIKTYGTTLDIVEHFPYLGRHLSQKATIEAEIQHHNILYHHILHDLRNRVTHNFMEETKVMFYKAVCTITLH